MSNQAPADSGRTRPLERYVQILETLAAFPEGLSATQIGQMLGLDKSAMTRLLGGLLDSHLIEGTSGRGGVYRIGARMTRLLHQSADAAQIEAASRHHLKQLAESSGETCFIARLVGQEIRSVAMETPDSRIGVYVTPGHPLLPHATASGKAIMAFQSKETVRAALRAPLQRYTPATKVPRTAVMADYETIRSRGWAVEIGEHVEGLATVACPIQIAGLGVYYSVGLTGPTERIRPRIESKLVPLLKDTAHRLGLALHGSAGSQQG